MIKIVCWNINRSTEAYPKLQEMDADVALLQEVGPGAAEQMEGALCGAAHWDWGKCGRWPAVDKLSDRVEVECFRPIPLPVMSVEHGEIAVSDPATLAAALITPTDKAIDPFVVVSMYARWHDPHPLADNEYIYSDAAVHRIISDLTAFIGGWPKAHRIIAAGDLNTIYGATEASRLETPIRAQTIFDRMNAIGMEFVGPRAGDGSRKADEAPVDVSPHTCNVPTYLSHPQRTQYEKEDILSGNQLDYVFASRGFHESVRVHAMNKTLDEWGPSDHCRIVIDVGQGRVAD